MHNKLKWVGANFDTIYMEEDGSKVEQDTYIYTNKRRTYVPTRYEYLYEQETYTYQTPWWYSAINRKA